MTPLLIAALSAFNLICSGTETSGQPDPSSFSRGIKQAPFTEIYRVDLKSSRWCRGECRATNAIVSVTPTQIQFQQDEGPGGGGSEYAFAKREDGFFRHMQKIGPWVSIREGTCTSAPFAGFPTPKF